MLIFSLDGQSAFAQSLAANLDRPIAAHEERHFTDGERKLRPLVDPHGADVYVLHGLQGDAGDSPHDKLCRLLMFVATLRDHGAARVTAVVPYVAYARKDRRTKPFDPVTLRYVAQMVEALGTQQVLSLQVHDEAAFENAFRCPVQTLSAHPAFLDVASECAAAGKVAVASPDPGGVKRAQRWREHFEEHLQRPVGFAMVDKRRSAGLLSGGELVAGDVHDATVLLVDDLIATGETMQRAAHALRREGARGVVACAAHGLFNDPTCSALLDDAIAQVVVTDSIPAQRVPHDSALQGKLQRVSCVPLLAEAIRSSHEAWRR